MDLNYAFFIGVSSEAYRFSISLSFSLEITTMWEMTEISLLLVPNLVRPGNDSFFRDCG